MRKYKSEYWTEHYNFLELKPSIVNLEVGDYNYIKSKFTTETIRFEYSYGINRIIIYDLIIYRMIDDYYLACTPIDVFYKCDQLYGLEKFLEERKKNWNT